MKKILILLISTLTLTSLHAQKFGFIDSQELLLLMPERKTAETELQEYEKSLEASLAAMMSEYQQSVENFQANESTYSDLIKKDKYAEIAGLEQRIQSFEQNAKQSLLSRQQELFEPLLEKARNAINEVAEEGKYTYIFDKSMGTLLYAEESENIISKVKKKLGL